MPPRSRKKRRLTDVHNWAPIPDPFKPPIPYRAGTSLQIKSHKPPPPFGLRWYAWEYPRPTSFLYDGDPIQIQSVFCCKYPVVETEPPPNPTSHTLRIVREIAVDDPRRSQIVVCQLDGDEQLYVAKIFDPLYTEWSPDPDPSWLSDKGYTAEAIAYEELTSAGLAGSIVPKYYGSWTFKQELVVDSKPRERWVRMVLLEYLDGTTILDLVIGHRTGTKLPQEARLNILAKYYDALARVEFAGINHGDIACRNAMCVGSDLQSPNLRVCITDFEVSSVRHLSIYGRLEERSLPTNPKESKWNGVPSEFSKWIPSEWKTNRRLYQEWLDMVFGKAKGYEPVGEDLEWASEGKGAVG